MERLEKDILAILEADSRTPADRLAAMLGISEEQAKAEVKRLEEQGVIVKYTAITNSDEIDESSGYDLAVIVEGKSLKSVSRFVSERISTYDTVLSTATHFILKKYKVEGALMKKTDENRLSIQP